MRSNPKPIARLSEREVERLLGLVILSLGYLASQIRTQNRESRLAANTEWTNQWNDFLVSFAEHPNLSEVWSKGLKDFSSLNPTEVVQFSSQLGRLFRVGEGIHDQYRQGRFDPKTWRGVKRTLEDVARFPGAKAWWPTRSHWYSDEFTTLVQPAFDSTEPQRLYFDPMLPERGEG
jgi:hypothetical protein